MCLKEGVLICWCKNWSDNLAIDHNDLYSLSFEPETSDSNVQYDKIIQHNIQHKYYTVKIVSISFLNK